MSSVKGRSKQIEWFKGNSGVAGLSLFQIEERLEKSILKATLVLYILKNLGKPTSKVIRDLLQMEIEVGKFIGQAREMNTEQIEALFEEGFLASTLSFIPKRSRKD